MSGSRRTRRRGPLTHGILAALCASTPLVAGCESDSGTSPGPSRSASAAPSPPGGGTTLQEEYRSVVDDVLPSVVQITTTSELGSGIVYDDTGHIVTNAHVVGDARTFEVSLPTGGDDFAATLVSSYPAQDLAVIKLTEPPQSLKPAVFGDSGKVEVGQIVLAMGSPLGLSGSVTQGIVSAVGRTVTEGLTEGGTGATIGNMVQTSAAINPGNSGGALVNLDNEVIGIPTLAATESGDAAAGIGFAIPASTVTRIADQIIENGEVTESGRAALGITGRTVLNSAYRPAGVAVVSVAEGGGAAEAGIRAGDVITKLGDAAVTTNASLSEVLASNFSPGDTVDVTFLRDGVAKTVPVTLGEL